MYLNNRRIFFVDGFSILLHARNFLWATSIFQIPLFFKNRFVSNKTGLPFCPPSNHLTTMINPYGRSTHLFTGEKLEFSNNIYIDSQNDCVCWYSFSYMFFLWLLLVSKLMFPSRSEITSLIHRTIGNQNSSISSC